MLTVEVLRCGNAKSIGGGYAPSFSAQVRWGEPGAPVLFLVGSAMTQTPSGLNSEPAGCHADTLSGRA